MTDGVIEWRAGELRTLLCIDRPAAVTDTCPPLGGKVGQDEWMVSKRGIRPWWTVVF